MMDFQKEFDGKTPQKLLDEQGERMLIWVGDMEKNGLTKKQCLSLLIHNVMILARIINAQRELEKINGLKDA
ncbi:hypothetical protein [Acetobacter malorum]|nr:hypothetical protein [Acetobacter malorum]KXV05608.1 hypothetical protein AD930_10705 [Acetobacter malorum]